MMESDLGKAICVELAAISNMTYPHDVTPSMFNYPDSITQRELVLNDDCTLTVSSRPGTPILPDLEKMAPKVVASAKF